MKSKVKKEMLLNVKYFKKRLLAGFLALIMVLSMLSVLPVKTTKTASAATGAWGKLAINGTYLNIDSDGNAELRWDGSSRRIYMEDKGNNQVTLKISDGKYLGISDEIKNGTRLKLVSDAYIWNYKDGALRPPQNMDMVVNASGQKYADGTHIILWTHPGSTPAHGNFTFEKEYAIIFKANGGTGKMKNGIYSSDYTLPKSGFKRSGYKFVGWSTKKAADDSSFYVVGDNASYIPNKNKDVTLYAQWVKAKSYKISYVSVKGVKLPSKAIKKYTAGKYTELPYPDISGYPSKSVVGVTFAGWEITKNGKKLGVFMEISPYISGDLKLKPKVVDLEG
jgi:uncharacterized repeat protein (TIGR02543 family)